MLNRDVYIPDNGTACVDIDGLDDSIAEGSEQFFVSLSVPSRSRSTITIQSPSRATVTITDDGDGMCK